MWMRGKHPKMRYKEKQMNLSVIKMLFITTQKGENYISTV